MTDISKPLAANQPVVNILRCKDRIFISNRGYLYIGPAPFAFDKSLFSDMVKIMQRPWVIDHPSAGALGALWKVTGLDSYATWKIQQGSTIGLLIEPWLAPLTDSCFDRQ